MKQLTAIATLVGTSLLLLGAPRAAEPTEPAAMAPEGSSSSPSSGGASRVGGGTFGTEGQWVFSLSRPEEFPFYMFKQGDSDWDVLVQPSVDIFIASEITVGGNLLFHTSGGGTDLGIGARGGYNLSFTPLLSLWMRGGLFFHRLALPVGGSASETVFDVQAPLLVHLARHFFVGAGPIVSFFLTRSAMEDKPVTFGLRAILGGYI